MSEGESRSSVPRWAATIHRAGVVAAVLFLGWSGGDLHGQTPLIAGVQSGTATSAGAGTLTIAINAVDTAKAFLIFQTRHDRNRPPQSMLRGRIASSTTIEFVRVTDQSSPIDIQWYVVEYLSGVQVQRGEIASQNSTSIVVPITPVAAASQAFVTWSKTPAATNNGFDDRQPVLMEVGPRPELPDHLNFRVEGAASAHIIWWEVVEFLNAAHVNVQRGSTSFTSTDLSVDATLATPVDVNATFVLVGYTTEDPGLSVGTSMVRAQLIDATTIRIDRSLTGVALPEIVWQAVELKDGSAVARGSENFPSGVLQRTVALGSIDAARATPFASVQPVGGQNMGRSSLSTDDVIGVGSVTLAVNGSSIDMDRNNSDADADIGWFLVEWGASGLPPTLSSIDPDNGTPLGGDAVTLTGADFIGALTVSFDGVPATSVTRVDSQTVTAVSPAHASGIVDVSIANEFGSDTLTAGFSYGNAPLVTMVSPASGTPLGGDTVFLTGSDFTATTTVEFDGTPASGVVFVDSMTMTAMTPGHAPGLVDVTVANENGSTTLSTGFLYESPPTLTSISPANGTPLGGDTVSLAGTGFTSGTTVLFGASPAVSVNFVDANTLDAVTPAGSPSVVDVTVSNANGSDTLTSAFTYDSPPTLTSINPPSGTPLGGDTINITGTNFTAATTVDFGGNPAPSVNFVDANTLDAVTPPGSRGTVDVTVDNPNGSDTLTSAFTYESPPTLTTITPTNGTPLGGDTVTLTGTNFTAATTVTFGANPAASVNFVTATSLEAVTPPGSRGTVDVTVDNPNGSDLLAAAFTYDNPPTLTSIAPPSGTPLGGDTISLTGANFTAATTVDFGGNPAASVNFVSAVTLEAVTPPGSRGTVDVTVDNLNGSDLLAAAFTYENPPTLTSVAPTSGSAAGGDTVTLTGNDLTATTNVQFGGTPAASVTFLSGMTLEAVTPPGAGTVDVTVSNPNGSATLTAVFTFDSAPTLTSISPASGTPFGGDNVTLLGDGFTPGTTVDFGGISAMSVTFVNANTLNAVTPAGTPGSVDVAVFNANGSDTLVAGFTYENPPTVTSVVPPSGTPLGGDTVTLTGTGFTSGTSVDFGASPAISVTFVNATTLDAVTPPGSPGSVDVTVANPNGADTIAGGFTYENPPSLAAITPASGNPAGGTTVTLTGADLTSDVAVDFGGSVAPTVTFVSVNTIEAITPAGSGTVDVTVSNGNGGSTLAGAFTYIDPPTVVSVSPLRGSPLGGDLVTITGTDFTATTTVTFDATLAPAVTFVDSNTLTASTPPHPPATVDVTVSHSSGSNTLAGAFTYDNPPTLTTLSPTDGTPLGGNAVTLTGADFTATTAVHFGGNAASGVTLVDSATLTCVTPAHIPGTVAVTVSNENGSDTLVAAFTFNNPPTLITISPTAGTPLGGDTVTLAGADFTPVTAVLFGGAPATSVNFVAASTLVAVTPVHASGSVDVTVSDLNGSDTLVGAFTFNDAPSLTTVSPSSGTPLGGNNVTMAGTGFTPGVAVSFGGIPAASVMYVADTTLTAVTPPHSPGTVGVTVSNENGNHTLVGGFTYDNPPVLLTVNPANGTPLGGDTVMLTGTSLTASSAVDFGGTPAASVTFVDASTLTVVTPVGSAGAIVDVNVGNANGSHTLVGAFTYNDTPTLTTVFPASGSPAGGNVVTLSGVNFTPTTTVTLGGTPAPSVTFVDANSLIVTTPPHTVGTVDVSVLNENGTNTLTASFTYTDGPVLISVNPTNGTPLGGNAVTLNGINFTASTTVHFDATPAATVTFVDGNTLSSITPAHPPGPAVVTVANANGSDAITGGFLFNDPPTVISVSPDNGPPMGGVTVTISGSGFTATATVTFDGVAAPVTFLDPGTLETITPAHAPGPVTVAVTTINGTASLVGGFAYLPPPTLTSLNPTSGSQLGGTSVTVSGSDFTAMTSVLFDGIAASVTFVSDSVLSALTPAHAEGIVPVEIININGSDLLPGGFTYNPGPLPTALLPDHGNTAGGESVTITGNNFTPGSLVEFDGVSAVTTYVDANTLTAITPPHILGPVTVSVSNVDGTGSLPGAYTYVDDPTLVALSPNRAPVAGNTTVNLSGIGFVGGETVLFGTTPALSVVFVDNQTLAIVTPPLPAGVVDVTVANANGTGMLPQSFTYLPPPTITSVNPAEGDAAGGTMVTVLGTDLSVEGDVEVTFGGSEGTVTGVVAGTTATVMTPSGTGTVDVNIVTMGGSAVLPGGFTYTQLFFLRGDANVDGTLNIADGIYLIQYLFLPPSPTPTCFDAADANDDGSLDISDIIFSITFIFIQGPEPPPPFPTCGQDPSIDALDCATYSGC